jgi:hypothetical protein
VCAEEAGEEGADLLLVVDDQDPLVGVRRAQGIVYRQFCSGFHCDELDPVSPGIGEMASLDARNRGVVDDLRARRAQPTDELAVPGDCEGGVRLARWDEALLDADVELLGADSEPDAAARPQRLRLRHFLEPEQLAEEAARLGLAAGRRSYLDVVDPVEHSREG